MFQLIDLETWARREYFQHYFHEVPCFYSMTVKLDITRLRQSGERLYPALLYLLSTLVNRHEEFRMALDGQGRLGVYDQMHPSYTVFHPDSETFSNLWTEYRPAYPEFRAAFEADMAAYGQRPGFLGKPNPPSNAFPVSMLPWTAFEGFNLNLPRGEGYLQPIFTLGKYTPSNGRLFLPLAAQVHHAVCDGYHVCRLVNELQELLSAWGHPS